MASDLKRLDRQRREAEAKLRDSEAVSERRSRELKEYAQRAWAAEARLAEVEAALAPFADGCMGTGEYKLCHDISEAVEVALAAARGERAPS